MAEFIIPPAGTIRGPFHGSDGSPQPYQFLVRTDGGWVPFHGKTEFEAREQAEKFAETIAGVSAHSELAPMARAFEYRKFERRHGVQSGTSFWVGVEGDGECFARFHLNRQGKRGIDAHLSEAVSLAMSAPELLAACEVALAAVHANRSAVDPAIRKDAEEALRAAIAKAKGEKA